MTRALHAASSVAHPQAQPARRLLARTGICSHVPRQFPEPVESRFRGRYDSAARSPSSHPCCKRRRCRAPRHAHLYSLAHPGPSGTVRDCHAPPSLARPYHAATPVLPRLLTTPPHPVIAAPCPTHPSRPPFRRTAWPARPPAPANGSSRVVARFRDPGDERQLARRSSPPPPPAPCAHSIFQRCAPPALRRRKPR